ncbi:MAG: hypothetical protein ACLS43_01530 [Evtepia gabavorous]
MASSLESRIILTTPGRKSWWVGICSGFPVPGKPLRVQGCFISDEEVAVVDSVKQNAAAEYDDEVMADRAARHRIGRKRQVRRRRLPRRRGGEEEQDEPSPPVWM